MSRTGSTKCMYQALMTKSEFELICMFRVFKLLQDFFIATVDSYNSEVLTNVDTFCCTNT